MDKKWLVLVSVFGVFSLKAQTVQDLMSQGENYTEIRDKMYEKYEGKSFSKRSGNYSREFKQFKRWEYFWKHRLSPDGDFPSADALSKAWRDIQLSDAQMSKTTSANWEFFGPKNLPTSDITFYPGLGRINAIAMHPTNRNIILAGGAGSGVWKTTDKGQTWTPKMDAMPNVGISDIVYDPNNPNVIYAASGDADGNRNPYSTGLLKSTDGGETWAVFSLGQDPSAEFSIKRIAMPSSPANTLLITTSQGIQKSTDGGATFNVVSTVSAFGIWNVPNSNTDFYVGTSDGKIYRSTNTGDTWSEVNLGSATLFSRVELGFTADDENFIIALGQFGNIIKSVDGGSTWTTVTSPPQYDSQGGYNMTVAVSPTDKDRIIIGGVNGWRSADGGTTWENYLNGYWETGQPYFYVHSDHHVMKFIPGGSDTLLVGNDGGVFYGDISADDAFQDITEGLYITQYYGLGSLRTNRNVIIAGAQDNDATYINGNNIIGILPGSDGFDGMIDYADPNIAYASITGGATSKTTDGWQTAEDVNIPGFSSNWEVPMAMHPTNPSTLFYGGNKLMKTTDKATTWSELYSVPGQFNTIMELAVAPSDGDNIVFAVSNGELKRTTDGGQNWTDIIGSLPTTSPISGIAIHSTNPDTIYVSYSGFAVSTKVYKTTDAGATWENISYNLPNIPVNHIAYAAGTNDDVYIATDLGVYVNSAGANTWTFYNTNLPYTQVMELDFHYESNTIFAATYGRGIWRSSLLNNSLSTPELDNRVDIKVYPSPNNGVFSIDVKEFSGDYEVTVFNTVGGVVYHNTSTISSQKISLSDVVDGLYFVSIKIGEELVTKKIVVSANHD